jgi:hypothetical protein
VLLSIEAFATYTLSFNEQGSIALRSDGQSKRLLRGRGDQEAVERAFALLLRKTAYWIS